MKKLLMISLAMVVFMSCKNSSSNSSNNTEREEPVQEEKKKSILTDEEQKEGWKVLFDGSNLDQWRGYNSLELFDEWTIDDGTLKFTPSEEGGKNIITKEKFKNFILDLEWKISEGGNSGIFWSVYENLEYKEAYETGPEIQVLDNERHPDANVGGKTHQAGALYDMLEPSADVCKPAGEWNHVRLTIDHEQNIGKVELNGTQIEEFPVHGEEWDNMVENSKFKDWPGFGKYALGHLGLQDHGDVVWYRNIKLKNLEE